MILIKSHDENMKRLGLFITQYEEPNQGLKPQSGANWLGSEDNHPAKGWCPGKGSQHLFTKWWERKTEMVSDDA